jgi:hypothetical protein
MEVSGQLYALAVWYLIEQMIHIHGVVLYSAKFVIRTHLQVMKKSLFPLFH